MIKNVLTIAGTDCTGGAGIQADIKAISANGSYAMSVITAVVAQNTQGVQQIQMMPTDLIRAQLDSVFSDVQVDAVKIGMLGTAEVIRCVAEALQTYQPTKVVLDPVMVAKSGDRLLDSDAVAALRELLLPQVGLITPTCQKPLIYWVKLRPPPENRCSSRQSV
nr:bifunctional hydroxymethylpyrimidine kinase/phosphomethylpyrimidine kinase [Psychrobacter sp. PraFG1]UNK06127.1 bifunctional hydroxymethylpyrimidine kinase/phosphomethylpyrimidine kinase [Psychrobacter sp. PraFG1]